MKKLNIAVIGFGRSGCDIHGAFLRTADNDICNVKYVVEADPNRAAAAREIFGCETLSDYRELFAHRDELDFVTNAKIVYKYYLDEEVPTPVLEHRSIHKEDGTPAYCNNALVWHEEEVALKADVWNAFGMCTNRFYHAWYDTLVNGAELLLKPEHIKAQIAIFREIE